MPERTDRSIPARPEVVLDISRLLSRTLHATPTGVDRVEMAYANDLMRRIPDRLAFSAVHPVGLYGRLPTRAVVRFLSLTMARWQAGERIDAVALKLSAARHSMALYPRPIPRAAGPRVYLQASPHHLDNGARVSSILQREQASFVCLVHDVIPIVHPEYARVDGAAKHLKRIRTVADNAAGIISNSAATQEALIPFLREGGHRPHLRIAHLGVDDDAAADAAARTAPQPPQDRAIAGDYFVCIATIEPRKNHLLLLNIWRRMVELMGPAAPTLVLIGRRGWENEQIVDMLDRCAVLEGHVIEIGGMADDRMKALLAHARALLLPSFAEGFGMPVTEALSLGVPVIASDLGALREAGGDAPDYIDPLDGIGWMDRILDYAQPGSHTRAEQLVRIGRWSAPQWRQHLDIVMNLVDSLPAAG